MDEIRYKKTTEADIELLMRIRLEMLREVNDLSDEYVHEFDHPTGARAHLMNVYVKSDYRRKGISKKMVK